MLLCSDLLDIGKPDEAYAREADMAGEAGFAVRRLDARAMDEGDWERAVGRGVPAMPVERPGVYRGWMLEDDRYQLLHRESYVCGVRLINSPQQYRHCHHLPESYHLIEGRTPRTVWLPGDPDHQRIMGALSAFGDRPLVLKDYVKSQKHFWDQACFIPSALAGEVVRDVVSTFRDLQGNDLQGGLVFREFLDLESLGTHPASGMPISLEYRAVVLDGEPVASRRSGSSPACSAASAAGSSPPTWRARGTADG